MMTEPDSTEKGGFKGANDADFFIFNFKNMHKKTL